MPKPIVSVEIWKVNGFQFEIPAQRHLGHLRSACNAAHPAKFKVAARGAKNGRQGLKRCTLPDFWAHPSNFENKFCNSSTPMRKVENRDRIYNWGSLYASWVIYCAGGLYKCSGGLYGCSRGYMLLRGFKCCPGELYGDEEVLVATNVDFECWPTGMLTADNLGNI